MVTRRGRGLEWPERAVSSVGQSASLTPKMSGVRVPYRPVQSAMSIQFFLGVALVMVIGLAAQGAGAAANYADVVRGDSPVIQQSFDDQAAPSATPALGHAARHAGVVGSSDRINPDGDFTIEWWQFVPSIDTAG